MSNLPPTPALKDLGPEAWVDRWSKKHPLGWGYREFVWLQSRPGMTLIGLAHAMNKKSTKPIKDVIKAMDVL